MWKRPGQLLCGRTGFLMALPLEQSYRIGHCNPGQHQECLGPGPAPAWTLPGMSTRTIWPGTVSSSGIPTLSPNTPVLRSLGFHCPCPAQPLSKSQQTNSKTLLSRLPACSHNKAQEPLEANHTSRSCLSVPLQDCEPFPGLEGRDKNEVSTYYGPESLRAGKYFGMGLRFRSVPESQVLPPSLPRGSRGWRRGADRPSRPLPTTRSRGIQ